MMKVSSELDHDFQIGWDQKFLYAACKLLDGGPGFGMSEPN